MLKRGSRKQNRQSSTKFNPRKTILSNEDVFNSDIPDIKPKPLYLTKKKGHLRPKRRREQILRPFKEEEVYEGGKRRRKTYKRKLHKKRKTHKRKLHKKRTHRRRR